MNLLDKIYEKYGLFALICFDGLLGLSLLYFLWLLDRYFFGLF